METKIEYEDKLDYDAFVKQLDSYNKAFSYKRFYQPNIMEILRQLYDNFKNYHFSNALICVDRLRGFVKECKKETYYKKESEELSWILDNAEILANDFMSKGFENYIEDEEVKLTEKEKLKHKKAKIDNRLKEIQEINAPYLKMSLGLAFVIVAIIFYCIPSFFGKIATNHVCSFMLVVGVLFLFSEIRIRQNENIGWIGYSDKITSKKASVLLLQSFVYMIPLTVLYFFFSNVLLIKILFFIQVWLCSVIMINGIALLIVSNISKQIEKKFNIWGFILGIISVISFVIQMFQLFGVL